ncbi:Gfo/Idh/MocA family protein [Listeria sp. ILCC797]|uniref:Gfo/Idh/MocA family protein n=1 Tax=Listeria sp. ILCC797 TaxID=1918333 RepID=UPI000B58BF68|nr:Gfo/Idh/MocA family oxidoreductase [Listeria sp. ILCC797]
MKIGIIGTAHMHAESYVKHLRTLDVEIVGAFDRNNSRLAEFCKRHKLPAFKELNRLLKSDIDTVLICSENAFHADYAVASAMYGKHVIVEKPMALSVSEADKMILACESSKVKLMVAHPVRFSKVMQELKANVDAGNIGRVLAIDATNHGKNPGGWFTEPELSGGGAIIDHTIHMADMVYALFQPKIESVFATSENWTEGAAVEDTGLLHIRFQDGVFMSLDTSWNRPEAYPVWGDASLALVTENGYVHVDGFGRKGLRYTEEKPIHFDYYETDMDFLMLEAFKKAVDEGLPSPVPGAAGRFTVLLTKMAYASIEQEKLIYWEDIR